jgi:hypothetical protein
MLHFCRFAFHLLGQVLESLSHKLDVHRYDPAPDRGNGGVCRVCPLCRGNVCEPKAVETGVETAV